MPAVPAVQVLATTLPPAIPAKYSPELQILLNRMMQVCVCVCACGGGWLGGPGLGQGRLEAGRLGALCMPVPPSCPSARCR